MNIPEFVAKWASSKHTERASAQSWFSDLGSFLDLLPSTDSDVDGGDSCTFGSGAKNAGCNGWPDV